MTRACSPHSGKPYLPHSLTPSGHPCTGCQLTELEKSGLTELKRADRHTLMRRCLNWPFGTKCKPCMDLLKREVPIAEEKSWLDDLEPAPF